MSVLSTEAARTGRTAGMRIISIDGERFQFLMYRSLVIAPDSKLALMTEKSLPPLLRVSLLASLLTVNMLPPLPKVNMLPPLLKG